MSIDFTHFSHLSDVIALDHVSTGGQQAGNGGAGVNNGAITSTPTINFNPVNTATGADVNVGNGLHNDANHVSADTTAYQTNLVLADMSQNVAAGIGGAGGDHNVADGGDIGHLPFLYL
jgi:hypothetical protein